MLHGCRNCRPGTFALSPSPPRPAAPTCGDWDPRVIPQQGPVWPLPTSAPLPAAAAVARLPTRTPSRPLPPPTAHLLLLRSGAFSTTSFIARLSGAHQAGRREGGAGQGRRSCPGRPWWWPGLLPQPIRQGLPPLQASALSDAAAATSRSSLPPSTTAGVQSKRPCQGNKRDR